MLFSRHPGFRGRAQAPPRFEESWDADNYDQLDLNFGSTLAKNMAELFFR